MQDGIAFLQRWSLAQTVGSRGAITNANSGVERWACPSTNWLKCNVDVAVFQSSSKFGAGYVI